MMLLYIYIYENYYINNRKKIIKKIKLLYIIEWEKHSKATNKKARKKNNTEIIQQQK